MELGKALGLAKGVLALVESQLGAEAPEHGVKELKEAVSGVLALSVFMAGQLKDGVGLDDFAALLSKWENDAEFKSKLKAAVDGYDKLKDEAKDLDAAEVSELLTVVVDYVEPLVDALKKPEAEAPAVS